MYESNEKLPEIELDCIKNGKARIYVRWNFLELSTIDEFTNEEIIKYRFNQKVVWWIPPPTFKNNGNVVTTKVLDALNNIDKDATRANVVTYINLNASDIIGYAKDAYDLKSL